ncbi:hypothetical protein BS47DRAFT_1347317 [Hydnum rufescens UP504]|uniref:Reverse transcriptase n=1 Tax=Hydnum rufescens UP504 TaxID=1448309 RepID=A0A9P6AS94_9AGAM|nr:hypothetical protein BS47DRAFT_1347317 [Hydnum rufescens UP504]
MKWLRELGSYYAEFVLDEDKACECGEPVQTRTHILLECPMFEDDRHRLGKGEDRQM